MYKLLLVDDEPVIRMTFRNLLPWADTPWAIAGMVANGEEALTFLESTPVDIVITDMKMPQMDGLELIRHLKKGGFQGAILVLSNYSDFSLVRQAMQLGARDYLLKTDMEEDSMREALEQLSANLTSCTDARHIGTSMTDDYRRTLLRDFLLGYTLTEENCKDPAIMLPHTPYRLMNVVINAEQRAAARKSIRNILLANLNEQADVLCLNEQ
ncbi:MAG: response regulator [Clostridia bacterium]|nr:response regulator [Clostridia bacterium]